MTEQLAFEERFRDGGAVDGDERKGSAAAGGVHQPRDDFLADTAFAGDENLRVGTRRGPDILAEPLHGDTLTDQLDAFGTYSVI